MGRVLLRSAAIGAGSQPLLLPLFTSWLEGLFCEPMALPIESFAQMQRAYIQWLAQAQRTSGASLAGLCFDDWPGLGDSEGGGWDRSS
jgi:hypothetical protein